MTNEDEKHFQVEFVATVLGIVIALGLGLAATDIGESSFNSTRVTVGLLLVVVSLASYLVIVYRFKKMK